MKTRYDKTEARSVRYKKKDNPDNDETLLH